MTQEEKELLLKDICARLPYGVKITDGIHIITLKVRIDTAPATLAQFIHSKNLKYYLRPMSSMTDEEQFQLGRLLGAASYNLLKGEYSSLKELLEYVYKNHIDLFDLIPKGLAFEAPEGMYNNIITK